MNQLPDKKWVCNVCGFSSTGAEPPESCPQCGTDRDHFEEAHPGAKRYLAPILLVAMATPLNRFSNEHIVRLGDFVMSRARARFR